MIEICIFLGYELGFKIIPLWCILECYYKKVIILSYLLVSLLNHQILVIHLKSVYFQTNMLNLGTLTFYLKIRITITVVFFQDLDNGSGISSL